MDGRAIMTNTKLILSVIGILVFLYGANLFAVAITGYTQVVGKENIVPTPTSYLVSAIGALLIVVSGVFISPLYEIIFKKNKTLLSNNIRLAIIFMCLLIGIMSIFLANFSYTILSS